MLAVKDNPPQLAAALRDFFATLNRPGYRQENSPPSECCRKTLSHSHSSINEQENPLKTKWFFGTIVVDTIICTITSGMHIFTAQTFSNEGKNQGIQADSFRFCTLGQLGMG